MSRKAMSNTTYTLTEEELNIWRCSRCGLMWNLEVGGPAENEMNYCPKCGRKIACVKSRYEQKALGAKYDADNPHCRECDCAACHYFYLNSGDCCEACEECDGESHVRGCPMFGDPE